jgi:sec-independent protein translocase protein TatA
MAKPRRLGVSGRRTEGRLGGVTDLGWPELLIVAAIAMMLFGTKKMPDVARSIGRSMRIVKAELGGLRDEEPGTPEPTAAPAAAQPAAPPATAQAAPAAPAQPVPPVVPPTDVPIR